MPQRTDVFDFRREVSQTLADYPALKLDTAFATTAEGPPAVMHGTLSGCPKALLPVVRGLMAKMVYNARELYGGSRCNLLDVDTKKGPLVFRGMVLDERQASGPGLGGGDPEILKYFLFQHELGHILVPGAIRTLRAEMLADGFATLRTLQKFPHSHDTLRDFSAMRARDFVNRGETEHMTMTVMDGILAESAVRDFRKMSPAQTVEATLRYAERFEPDIRELSRAYALYRSLPDLIRREAGPEERVSFVLSTILSTPHKFAFNVGARAFQPLLEKGRVSMSRTEIRMAPEKLKALRKKMRRRAQAFKLDNLLAAERDLFPRRRPKKTPAPASPGRKARVSAAQRLP